MPRPASELAQLMYAFLVGELVRQPSRNIPQTIAGVAAAQRHFHPVAVFGNAELS
jgi:hypothetical protein